MGEAVDASSTRLRAVNISPGLSGCPERKTFTGQNANVNLKDLDCFLPGASDAHSASVALFFGVNTTPATDVAPRWTICDSPFSIVEHTLPNSCTWPSSSGCSSTPRRSPGTAGLAQLG